METDIKSCLHCGKELKGRVDKKFCNDFCRNNYNNELNSDANNLVRNINNTLRKNRRILKNHLPDDAETAKVKKEQLLQKGFQFKYHTHLYENQKQQTYFFCYEYGYLTFEDDWLLIVKQRKR